MKKNYFWKLATLGMLVTSSVFAQKDNVGIGTTKPEPSAVLDINSTSKGLLIPRMTLQQRNAIQSPASGLMVYQSDLLSGFYFYDGKEWKPLSSATTAQNSVAGTDGDWELTGSNLTATPNAFIGTTSNHRLQFKVNNVNAGYLDNTAYQQTFYGLNAGSSYTNISGSGFWNVALGYNSLRVATTGSYNTGLGAYTLEQNNGDGNTAIGALSLYKVTGGNYNMGLGSGTLRDLTTGSGNSAIGVNALIRTQGSNNVAIGYQAGINKTGNGNIYIGYFAGANGSSVTNDPTVVENNKLYITNTITQNPLIGGDFTASTLRINSKTTGYLAVGDFDAASPMPTPVGYRLIVQDGILTEKIKVALKTSATDWADYVFAKDYTLMPLDKVESFIHANKHLPNVPSADEMVKDGLDVSKTSKMLMEKIEELTLYVIEMNKEIKALKAENEKLKK